MAGAHSVERASYFTERHLVTYVNSVRLIVNHRIISHTYRKSPLADRRQSTCQSRAYAHSMISRFSFPNQVISGREGTGNKPVRSTSISKLIMRLSPSNAGAHKIATRSEPRWLCDQHIGVPRPYCWATGNELYMFAFFPSCTLPRRSPHGCDQMAREEAAPQGPDTPRLSVSQ